MPGTTTNLKIPYPLASDRLADYPTTARTAAQVLEAHLAPTTARVTAYTGWEIDTASAGTVTSLGRLHTLPLAIRRTDKSFRTGVGALFQLISLPAGVTPPPLDWQMLGMLAVGSFTQPLVWRANTQAIHVVPTSTYTVDVDTWCYGTATWIA